MAISSRHSRSGRTLAEWLDDMVDAGVESVQIREKELADRDLFFLACEARQRFPGPLRLLINARPDLALAAGADGVHLTGTGLPTAAVRAAFGEQLLIGRSTHQIEEVAAAAAEGADYVLFGPVWATPGKPRGVGLRALRRAAEEGIPVYAVGGVDVERLPAVADAGATGAAAIRLFRDRDTAAAAARQARSLFSAGRS